ncbi:MAG: adenine phosphoribosyltransferase [Firmicutes bacterium]|nr:adenine phosphoribosyltransferase [Bacillota bacterium]
MQKNYAVDICGRTEQLPILQIDKNLGIAFFNLHGNVELTEYCAAKLAKTVAGADVILTAESKGLQLAHCVARILGHPFYAVARKSKKLYLQNGIETVVQSITTAGEQRLYLSQTDAALLKDKKVAILDDVISTGGSLLGLERLTALAGGEVFIKAAVLAEGEAARRTDIAFLAEIPLLPL